MMVRFVFYLRVCACVCVPHRRGPHDLYGNGASTSVCVCVCVRAHAHLYVKEELNHVRMVVFMKCLMSVESDASSRLWLSILANS